MQEVAPLEITSALRAALKNRGLTYKDIAERIEVSEQTIKRLFKDKDCSLSRLNQVCNAIDVSVYDLLEVARAFSEPSTRLTEHQEAYLKDHPSHFSFLFFLTAGYTLDDIQQRYSLSDTIVFRYLRDLDRQAFIELSANNHYKLNIEGKLLMKLDGPLAQLVRDRNHLFLDYVLDRDGEPNTFFTSSFRLMSKDTLNAFHSEQEELALKYRKAAYQDAAILPRERLIPVKWSVTASEFDICGHWPLDQHIK